MVRPVGRTASGLEQCAKIKRLSVDAAAVAVLICE